MKDLYEDADRPWDWQDRLVVAASVVSAVVLMFILVWG